jgi:hypothetical protein
MARRDCLYCPEAALHGFDEHLAHRLAWQSFSLPGTPRHYLPVAAVLGERGNHGLARVALDFQAIGAPAQVAARDSHAAFMRA